MTDPYEFAADPAAAADQNPSEWINQSFEPEEMELDRFMEAYRSAAVEAIEANEQRRIRDYRKDQMMRNFMMIAILVASFLLMTRAGEGRFLGGILLISDVLLACSKFGLLFYDRPKQYREFMEKYNSSDEKMDAPKE